jgi:hypothetical protein
VPESRIRRKKKDSPVPASSAPAPMRLDSPRWLVPTMLGFFLLGLLYIVVFYISGTDVPLMRDLPPLANVGIGFAFLGIGFALATRWR